MTDGGSSTQEAAARVALGRIGELSTSPVSLMEVCGTHTVAISRFGLRSLMPAHLRLLSGPGCPVCVTPIADIDRAIEAATSDGVTVVTFGDMMNVPGSRSSLEKARADGADVRIVYSPLESLDFAAAHPDREVVFVGVGFETTSPVIAATVKRAAERNIANFSVLPFFKRVPPALEMLARVPDRALDGFICPGHVSTIIGAGAYEPIADEHNIPCVVTGFEPMDILQGILMLLRQIDAVRNRGGRASVEVQYKRAVTDEGNQSAQQLLEEVFDVCDADWREIGTIEGSGYEFAERYARFDAGRRLDLPVPPPARATGCICGEIMLGLRLPSDCALFATTCTPRDPVGPCMVSSEGACAAFYKYDEHAPRGSGVEPERAR